MHSHPRLRSRFIAASANSQPGMQLIKPLSVRARFHALSYGRVRSVKLAGRRFPWNSHLRGRKVNFAADDVQQSCSHAAAAAAVAAILFRVKGWRKMPDGSYRGSSNATARFHCGRDRIFLRNTWISTVMQSLPII